MILCPSILFLLVIVLQGFQAGGAHLKKLRRAEGGSKIFRVFRVKNHILRQQIIFFPIAEEGANFFGVKGAPPLDPPLHLRLLITLKHFKSFLATTQIITFFSNVMCVEIKLINKLIDK
jgi:hypothetical protein